jgi:hypothetical protein
MLDLPSELEAFAVADWIELSSFIEYPRLISRIAIENHLEAESDESELIAANAFKVIRHRKSLSQKYPFELTSHQIKATGKITERLEYGFPLMLSCHNFYSDTKIANWSEIGDLFELYCTSSVSQLLGRAALIGNAFGGLSGNFDGCLKQVCELMNERKGPKHEKADDFQDAGVDIIAWKNFDKRKGQIVFLIQCASGQNWRKKGGDISSKLWHELVFWTVSPIKILAFPYAFDFNSPQAQKDWHFYAYDSGLLMDRMRLSNFCASKSAIDLSPLCGWMIRHLAVLQSHSAE